MPLRCNSSEHIIGLIAGFSPLLHPTCLSELCQLPRQPPPVFTRPVEEPLRITLIVRIVTLPFRNIMLIARQRTVTCCYASLESMNMRSCALLETSDGA